MRKILNISVSILSLSLLFALTAKSQCTTCTYTVSTNSSTGYNLNSGQTLCISGGTYTGSVNFNGSATICVSAGAIFKPSSFNNFGSGSTLNVYGNAIFSSVSFGGGSINIQGEMSFSSSPNFNGAVSFYIGSKGALLFEQAVTISNNSTIINDGVIIAKGDFSSNSGTRITNNNSIRVSTASGNFNPSGYFTNNGIVTSKFINANNGDAFINNCRLVATSGFNVNDPDFQNHGFIWVPGDNTSSGKVQLNATTDNTNGYIRTPQILIQANVNNTGGNIRAEGSSSPTTNVSVFNSGIVTGGTVGDISNGTLVTPNYKFDVVNGTFNATWGNVPASDTLTLEYCPNCSNTYITPVSFGLITANIKNNILNINWITQTEENNHHFDIEISKDGNNWKTIGKINSAALNGNSDIELKYEYHQSLTDVEALLSISALFGLFTLGLGYGKNKYLNILLICFVFLLGITSGCNKTKGSLEVETNTKIWVRIVQFDKDGKQKVTPIIQAIRE